MKTKHLVVEGDSVYEIDEQCMKEKLQQEEKSAQKKNKIVKQEKKGCADSESR